MPHNIYAEWRPLPDDAAEVILTNKDLAIHKYEKILTKPHFPRALQARAHLLLYRLIVEANIHRAEQHLDEGWKLVAVLDPLLDPFLKADAKLCRMDFVERRGRSNNRCRPVQGQTHMGVKAYSKILFFLRAECIFAGFLDARSLTRRYTVREMYACLQRTKVSLSAARRMSALTRTSANCSTE
jgi:hypothetical protein